MLVIVVYVCFGMGFSGESIFGMLFNPPTRFHSFLYYKKSLYKETVSGFWVIEQMVLGQTLACFTSPNDDVINQGIVLLVK